MMGINLYDIHLSKVSPADIKLQDVLQKMKFGFDGEPTKRNQIG